MLLAVRTLHVSELSFVVVLTALEIRFYIGSRRRSRSRPIRRSRANRSDIRSAMRWALCAFCSYFLHSSRDAGGSSIFCVTLHSILSMARRSRMILRQNLEAFCGERMFGGRGDRILAIV